MTKVDDYRNKLRGLSDWTPYLLKESGLPGPRGTLELAQAVAELGDTAQIEAFLTGHYARSAENTPGVFVVFCGVAALGKLAASGDRSHMARLRAYAGDSRWRVREAVAIALQYVGDSDMPRLLADMRTWARGTWYEKRAAAAALAEPMLLKSGRDTSAVLKVLDHITTDIKANAAPKDESFVTCRKTMGYAWSVAVAAAPSIGKAFMERWFVVGEANVRWVMKENLKKARLARAEPEWVLKWRTRLGA